MGELAGKLRRGSIVVCGTNGKTTTNNVLASAVEAAATSVLCNRVGANMAPGVTSALLPGSSADWAVMEADELSTIDILPALKPTYLVLLNLFRDQLDRAGEIDRVQDTIVRALAASPQTTLVVDGDDPLCVGVAYRAAAAGTKVLAFGIGGPAPAARPRARGPLLPALRRRAGVRLPQLRAAWVVPVPTATSSAGARLRGNGRQGRPHGRLGV